MNRSFFRVSAAVLLAGVFLFPLSGRAAPEKCLKDACFRTEKEVAGQVLPLKGMKLFEYWKFDLYTAAFYAPADARGIDAVLADVPKSLVLHYHRRIRPADMNKAARHALRKDPALDLDKLSPRLEKLEAVYEPVNKGDRYELRYEPGKGMSLLFNGQEKLTLPGHDLSRAYFGIWLGHYPLNRGLRDTLLGETSGSPVR